ncbi:MAG: hypothetical protein NWE98_09405 [Candidatus Bathyarchaeota archaeon]|nr:hypothetical protein [Candidatus Bathyarchaeota archaeon]
MVKKKGEEYRCEECGLVVLVSNPCECESCELICCEEPMKPLRTPSKASTAKAPAKPAPAAKSTTEKPPENPPEKSNKK